MQKFLSHHVKRMLEEKKNNQVLNNMGDCNHMDIIKSFKHGQANCYVCLDCGMNSRHRAAFFSRPQCDKLLG